MEAVVRPGSEERLPPGATAVLADALRGESYSSRLKPSHVFVQLVGVSHPGPFKAPLFRKVDLVAGLEAVRVAALARVRRFVYLSVAHPAPVMRAYIDVRRQVETALRQSGLSGAIMRPWYVLGPGHWWPLVLVPFYALLKRVPFLSEGARRLDLLTVDEMTAALVAAVESDGRGIEVWDVPRIRSSRLSPGQPPATAN